MSAMERRWRSRHRLAEPALGDDLETCSLDRPRNRRFVGRPAVEGRGLLRSSASRNENPQPAEVDVCSNALVAVRRV
jgi:hypothetical protein